MAGLPRAIDTTPPRDCWRIMVLAPVERLTEALMRGDAFDASSLSDMEALRRRLDAFGRALDSRLAAMRNE